MAPKNVSKLGDDANAKKKTAVKKTATSKVVKTKIEENKDTALTKSKKSALAEVSKESATEVNAKKSKTPNNEEILNKNNYDPMDEVLHIKALNDEKKENAILRKNAKIATKEVKKASKSYETPKGAKASFANAKRDEVKENAMKAEAKKFIALKEENEAKDAECNSIIKATLDGYKNIFSYKSRTNRFELWSFMIMNFILALSLFGLIVYMADKIDYVWTGAFCVLLTIFEVLVLLAISVRRIHDTGRSAWRGFYRPLVLSFLLYAGFGGYFMYLTKSFAQIEAVSFAKLLSIGVGAIVAGIVNIYYVIKVSITIYFVEEDRNDNEFGKAKVLSQELVSKTISIACYYFILLFISYVVNNAFLLLPSMQRGM